MNETVSLTTTHSIDYNPDGSATITVQHFTTWPDAPTRLRRTVRIQVPANKEKYNFSGDYK